MKILNSITNHVSVTKSTIIFTLIILSSFAFSTSAQELVSRKHGTVREQMEQSSLRQNHRSVVSDLLDYAFKFRGVP